MAISKGINKKAFLDIKIYGEVDTLQELVDSPDTDLNGKFFRVKDADYPLFYRIKQGFVNSGFSRGLAQNAAGVFLVDVGLSQQSQTTELSRSFAQSVNDYYLREGYNCYYNGAGLLEKTNPNLGAHMIETQYFAETQKTLVRKYIVISNERVNPSKVLATVETLDHQTGVLTFETPGTLIPGNSMFFNDSFTGANGDTV